jgi:hypothetical protein
MATLSIVQLLETGVLEVEISTETPLVLDQVPLWA